MDNMTHSEFEAKAAADREASRKAAETKAAETKLASERVSDPFPTSYPANYPMSDGKIVSKDGFVNTTNTDPPMSDGKPILWDGPALPSDYQTTDVRGLDGRTTAYPDNRFDEGFDNRSNTVIPRLGTDNSFNLTSKDRFLLVDANGDGIPDAIVIQRWNPEVEAARRSAAKHSDYHQHVNYARRIAATQNAGKSANEIAAAVTVAESRAKASWKGAVPPVTKAEVAAAAKAKFDHDEAFEVRAAIQAELNKMNHKS